MSFLIGMAVVLAVLWVISFIVLHVAGALIHLLIVIAAVLFVVGLFTRKKA